MAKKPIIPNPEVKLEPKKAIPHIDLQNKFKEVAKLKSDLIKERQSLINDTNKKIAEISNKIMEYEGSMKILMELMNMKKGGKKKDGDNQDHQ